MAYPDPEDVKGEIRRAAEKIAKRLQDVPGDADLVTAAAAFFSAEVVADALDVEEYDDSD